MLLTTSRRPTGRIRTFCRDLACSIPDAVRVNRGKMSLDGVAEKAIEVDADRVVVVDRWHGGPGKISLFQISSNGLTPVPPLMLIKSINLRRELNEARRGSKSSVITLDSKNSELTRIAAHLSTFFGLPVLPLDEASKNYRASMHFSFDSSRHIQITFTSLGRMVEIGPRVTFSKLVWDVTS
jgi:U3 small nucleolar ribonucleoprotein protein IMP4